MPVFTFLERYDFTGKVIRPFCTHEGSGFGKSIENMKHLCPGAVVAQGLEVHGRIKPDDMECLDRWIVGNPNGG